MERRGPSGTFEHEARLPGPEHARLELLIGKAERGRDGGNARCPGSEDPHLDVIGIHRTVPDRYRYDTIDPVARRRYNEHYGDAETHAGARTAAEGNRKMPSEQE
jgi:hypothetical protein